MSLLALIPAFASGEIAELNLREEKADGSLPPAAHGVVQLLQRSELRTCAHHQRLEALERLELVAFADRCAGVWKDEANREATLVNATGPEVHQHLVVPGQGEGALLTAPLSPAVARIYGQPAAADRAGLARQTQPRRRRSFLPHEPNSRRSEGENAVEVRKPVAGRSGMGFWRAA
jgi:hypothetical protein